MDTSIFSTLAAHYEWKLSLIALVAIMGIPFVFKHVLAMIPTIKRAQELNKQVADKKMERKVYSENQKWNKKWASLYLVVAFAGVLPFCLTTETQAWWKFLVDVFVILMVYDFFYYLTHRFLFHESNGVQGPLMWMHAIHHQQNNPCRLDSSYIHPLEVAIGLGLYVATIFGLSFVLGNFHVGTIIVTWIAFSEINLHNHDRWESDKFPFKYLNYASVMHHNHHVRFTGGNFATITLFYDWLFGSYDTGNGWGKNKREPIAEKASA
ncbi:MAG: sterol desaturase family protein [Spongiibacteraceae bacterium]